jgi:deoxyxylulose-5-phosphate synthase
MKASLGVVEFRHRVALRVRFPRDKVVWMWGAGLRLEALTGRNARFDSLRQAGGFPASPPRQRITSEPGMRHRMLRRGWPPRDLRGEDHKVVAVVGDGR